MKSLSKNEVEAAYDCAQSKIIKQPDNLYLNFVLAEVQSNRGFGHYEIYNAYQSIINASKFYVSAPDGDQEKFRKVFTKFQYDTNFIEISLQSICEKALIDVKNIKTVSAYNKFIQIIDVLEYNNKGIRLRNSLAFDIAKADNSIKSIETFIEEYPGAIEKSQAIELRNILAFNEAKEGNTIISFQYFIDTYPDAAEITQAIALRNKLAFENTKEINTVESFQDFIDTYPDAAEIPKAIELRNEVAFLTAKKQNSIIAYKEFVDNYPNAILVDSAVSIIYELAYNEIEDIFSNWNRYQQYYEKYPSSPFSSIAFEKYNEYYFLHNTIPNNGFSFISFIEENPGNEYIEAAIDSISQIGKRNNDLIMIQYMIKNYEERINLEEALNIVYDIISSDGEISSIEWFTQNYAINGSIERRINSDLIIAQKSKDLIFIRGLLEENNSLDNFEKRLTREGAKGGDVQISLLWNNYNDIDLHCIDPSGEEIFYSRKTSSSGGELDVDMNAGGPSSNEPVENIYWPSEGAPNGSYKIFVNHYAKHGGYDSQDPTSYQVRLKINGQTKVFDGRISHGENKKLIFQFSYNQNKAFNFELNMTEIKLAESYIKSAAPYRQAYRALVGLLKRLIDNKNWSQVTSIVKKFRPYFNTDKDYLKLLELVSGPSNSEIKKQSFPKYLNTKEGNEYSPTISGDFKSLYFCGKNRSDNLGKEDIYFSKNISGKWEKPELVESLCNYNTNEAPLSISTDGTKMLMFREGQIYFVEKTESGWSNPELIEDPINNGQWNADAVLTSDGMAILFTSTRKGGYNFKENISANKNYPSDIYICERNNYGWSRPINLGSLINTSGSERTPFLHPDMKTLYFSSDGHGGFGDQDVYKSTRLNDSSWTDWSIPINLGKEINGSGKDWGYKISTDGKKAYFSEQVTNTTNMNLSWLNLPSSMRPDLVATVSGELISKNNEPIHAKIFYEDLNTGKQVGESQSDPVDGSFFIVLPLGKIYGYHVEKQDYFPISGNLDLRNTTEIVEKMDTINMVTFKEMIDNGQAIPVNNLFFHLGKKELLAYSIPELKRVAEVVNKNNLTIEIAGHTDDIGDSTANYELSIKRAESVKIFLINKGCSEDALQIIGYGDSKPVATNENDEGRARNRRVEIKIINN